MTIEQRTNGADSQLSDTPAIPTLHAEYRLVLLLDHGRYEHVVPVANRDEGEWQAAKLRSATWRIDVRMVPSWTHGPVMRTRTVVEHVEDIPGTNGQQQR
jgi:hypothetical protein